MDEFLYECNFIIYAYYIFYQLPFEADLTKEKDRILIKSRTLPNDCEISFWLNHVIETVITQNENIVYYLHFEFISFKKTNPIFDDFFNYIKEHDYDKKFEVLICCSGGFTSSFFAEGLKKEAKRRQSNVIIHSGCYSHIQWQNIDKQYDLILLAPQIGYLLTEHQNCSCIKTIPTNLYATCNYGKVFDLIYQ